MDSFLSSVRSTMIQQGSQGAIDKDFIRKLLRSSWPRLQQIDFNTISDYCLQNYPSSLSQADCQSISYVFNQQASKLKKPAKHYTFLFSSLLRSHKNKIYLGNPEELGYSLDVNADWKDILGEGYWKKLMAYGTGGLISEKEAEGEKVQKYIYYHWVQCKVDFHLQETDPFELQLLKSIWAFDLPKALSLIGNLKSLTPQLQSIEIGLRNLSSLRCKVTENEQLKEVFQERSQWQINLVSEDNSQEAIQFSKAMLQIKRGIDFTTDYFGRVGISFKNKLYQALASFISNRKDIREHTNIYDNILNNENIPLFERFLFAKRFLPPILFQSYKSTIQPTSIPPTLDSILIYGTKKQSQIALQCYLDEYSDLQRVAIVSVYLKVLLEQGKLGRDGKVYASFIRSYEFLLMRVDGGIAKHLFDQKSLSVQIERKRKTLTKTFTFNCLNCKNSQCLVSLWKRIQQDSKQPRMKGYPYFSKDPRLQLMYCIDCMNMLAKCAVCLIPITVWNGFVGEGRKEDSKRKTEQISKAVVWCMKCYHGGHYKCIQQWLQRSGRCAVANCKCKCSL